MFRKYLLIISLIFAFLQQAAAYPDTPCPLRELAIESSKIIVGNVIKIYDKQLNRKKFIHLARITILQRLKGPVAEDTIEIEFTEAHSCPEPPHFFGNTKVIVFMDLNNGGYIIHGGMYGVKTLSAIAIDIYKLRINEILQISQTQNTTMQMYQTTEWLVKCAEQEATRWQGTYELSPESDFMSDFSLPVEHKNYKKYLTQNQKDRLLNALLKCSNPESVDMGLVDLVYAGNEKKVDSVLISGMRNITDSTLYMADIYFHHFGQVNKSTKVTGLISEFEANEIKGGQESELKRIIKEMIKLVE